MTMATVNFYCESDSTFLELINSMDMFEYMLWLPTEDDCLPKRVDLICLNYPASSMTQKQMVDLAKEIVSSDKEFLIRSNNEILFTALRVEVSQGTLAAGNFNIWYKDQKLDIDSNGNLSYWPQGFFDTMNSLLDLLYLQQRQSSVAATSLTEVLDD